MNPKFLIPRPVKQRVKRELVLKNRVLIGTHHKTGTVWMQKMFADIARRFGLVLVRMRRDDAEPTALYDIFIHTHSEFPSLPADPFKGMHIVRDPRDLIVSATFYHQKSEEPWLHIPEEAFGGLTYQEKLNSYESFEDKMLFEMEHSSARNIRSMKDWDYTDARFLNVKYETLIEDFKLIEFEKVFRHLGFRDHATGWCLVDAYRNSLFSGAQTTGHVRSGKPRQWPQYFQKRQKERFVELFGDVLERLGYPEDEDW